MVPTALHGKDTTMDKQQIRRFVEGALVGGIALSAVMFGTGWAIKSSDAEINAREQSRAAVIESMAPICVAQYDAAGNTAGKLTTMATIESWKRGEFVAKQGWATMLGGDSADNLVADECATLLTKRSG